MKNEESFMTNLMKFYVMVLLNERKCCGYELMEHVGRLTGKKPSAGQIYPLLKKLVRKGYLRSAAERGGRKKKTYAITPCGRKMCKSLMNSFESLISAAIESSIRKCAHCGCNVYKGGYEKTVRKRKLVFCCEYCARDFR